MCPSLPPATPQLRGGLQLSMSKLHVHAHAHAHAARPCPCCMSMLPVYRLCNSGLRNMQRFVRGMCKQGLLLCCSLSDGQDHGADGQLPEGHSGQGLQQFQW
jgi:hypothetical protein